MPRSTREYLMRYADQALNDLDRALEKLMQIRDIYQGVKPADAIDPNSGELIQADETPPQAPEHHAAITNVGIIVTQAREFLSDFRYRFM